MYSLQRRFVWKQIKTTGRTSDMMIIKTHLLESLDECVLGMNSLGFLNELNSKLSVPNPGMDEKDDTSLLLSMPRIC